MLQNSKIYPLSCSSVLFSLIWLKSGDAATGRGLCDGVRGHNRECVIIWSAISIWVVPSLPELTVLNMKNFHLKMTVFIVHILCKL